MNCEEAKAHFVDYLDKSLDSATTTRVATHLISCAPCGAEASEIADCMHQVAALPAIDPPLGFAQRVMAHVREIETQPTLWNRLFLSWGKKLPLQAAALVMIGVLGVLLYRQDDPLKRSELKGMTRSARLEPASPSEENLPADARQSDKKKESAFQAPTVIAKRSKPAPETQQLRAPASMQSQNAQPEVEVISRETQKFRRPPIQVQEASTMRDRGRFSGDSGFPPPIPLGGLRPVAPPPGAMTLERIMSLGEPVADYEFVVRRRPVPRRDLADDQGTNSAPEAMEADIATSPAAPTRANPRIESIVEIRFYNVPPEHYEYFRKELASEAVIETEPKPAAKERQLASANRDLIIKVTVLPPLLPEFPSTPR